MKGPKSYSKYIGKKPEESDEQALKDKHKLLECDDEVHVFIGKRKSCQCGEETQ